MNLIEKDCNFNFLTANCIPVDSLVDSFKDNFVDSINNDKAVKDFYSLYNKCDDTEPVVSIVFQIDKVERALFRLSSSSVLDCNRLSSLHLKYAHPAIYSI